MKTECLNQKTSNYVIPKNLVTYLKMYFKAMSSSSWHDVIFMLPFLLFNKNVTHFFITSLLTNPNNIRLIDDTRGAWLLKYIKVIKATDTACLFVLPLKDFEDKMNKLLITQ